MTSRSDAPVSRTRFVFVSIALLLLATPLLGRGSLLSREDSPVAPRTRVFLVRHADRNGKADELTEAGIERAKHLAHVFEKCALDAVYHSDRVRTKATAMPVCERLGIPPIERPAADVDGLVEEIRARQVGKTVLVVGHSDTVPKIAKALGGGEFTIRDDEFDDLVLVEFGTDPTRPATMLRLQYGAASP